MKKTAMILIAIACFAALTACTPSMDDLKSKYGEAGYRVHPMLTDQLVAYGADPQKVGDEFYATKASLTAYVVLFNDVGAAEEFERSLGSRSGLSVLRRGNVVIFGHDDAVAVVR